MENEEILALVTRLKPFEILPREFAVDLSRELRVKKHGAKEIIFRESDEASEGYILVSGRVAMLKCSPNGKELIVELIAPGDPFGVIAFLEKKPFPLTARAQIPSTSLALSSTTARSLMQYHPGFQQVLFGIVRDRMQTAHNLARAIAHDRVESRLADVLIAMLPKYTDSKAPVRIEISRQELADLTAMTIESASRVTKGFEREGIIDASEQGALLVLDPERLRQFSATSL